MLKQQLLIVIHTALALVPFVACQQLQTLAGGQNESFAKQEIAPLLAQEGPSQVIGASTLDNNNNNNETSQLTSTTSFNSTTQPINSTEQLVVSPSEQVHDNSSSGSSLPSPTFYYGDDEPPRITNRGEDNSEGGESDLNFSLMNAPHERIQAVQNLLSSRNMMQQEDKPLQYYQTLAQPVNSMHCTHKGRQYSHGQSVPIEEQPCLNCTCRRAVLQCFLRVCPPVISLEAQRRMQQIAGVENGGAPQLCRTVKEASHCCPSLRCEPEQGAHQQQQQRQMPNNSSSDSHLDRQATIQQQFGHNSDASIVSLTDSNEQHQATARAKTNKDAEGSAPGFHLQQQQQQQQHNQSINHRSQSGELSTSFSDVSTTTTTPVNNDEDRLPKLTVINGASGQRDSILLITSNPSSHHASAHQFNGNDKQSARDGPNATATNHQLTIGGRQDYAHALMEALLETVYSSAAQLNGLNLQGSCMINGSLYVEGSAVIPEGNAICQYCYCIRQKIMCVRPKCHLIISGCTPKYSNEYACCPTSYSCANSESSSLTNLGGSARSGGPARLSAAATMNQQALSSKLWEALESIGSQVQSSPSPTLKQQGLLDAALNLRQVDQEVSNHLNPATMLALMNSAGVGKLAGQSANNETICSPDVTATTTPTTTTTSMTLPSTTNIRPVGGVSYEDSVAARTRGDFDGPVIEGRLAPEVAATGAAAADDDDDDNDDGNYDTTTTTTGDQNPGDLLVNNEPTVRDKELTERIATTTTTQFGQPFNTTTEQPSSVSDFLEPMNKLGPLIVAPSAPSGCIENNRQYAIGEQIPTLESCKHCYCGLEGLKECKMIECSLKIVHNCRPITPEGHCCPIRYECPQTNVAHQQNNNLTQRSRYRSSETSGDLQAPDQNTEHLPLTPPTTTIDVSIRPTGCKGDSTREGEDCHEETTSTSQPNGGDTSPETFVEHGIRTLRDSVDDAPVFKTTRFIQSEPPQPATTVFPPQAPPVTTGITSITTNTLGGDLVQDLSVQNGTAPALNLTEELNKFIMQIKQGGPVTPTTITTTTTIRNTQDYSPVPAPPTNETSQEMMINEQKSRMLDYHSVQAQAVMQQQPPCSTPGPQMDFYSTSSLPPPLPNGIMGIPSIRIEPMNEQLPVQSSGQSLLENSGLINQLQGGQRDSRSANGGPPRQQFVTDLLSSAPKMIDLRQPPEVSAVGILPEYLVDQSSGSTGPTGANLTSALDMIMSYEDPPARSTQREPNTHLGPQSNQSGSLVVDFDDDFGSTTEDSSNGGSTTPDSEVDTTTGTPIGLEADQSLETRGWLQSLSGVVRSFGRRLAGSATAPQNTSPAPSGGRQSELLAAGSASDSERSNPNDQSRTTRRSPQPLASMHYETARSRSSASILDQLFKSVIGVSEGDPIKAASNSNQQMAPTPLIMNPPMKLDATNPKNQVPEADPRLQASVNEPVEIVTAAEANEPEIFTQPPIDHKASTGGAQMMKFSRRSDIDDDGDLMSMASTTVATAAAPRFLATDESRSNSGTYGFMNMASNRQVAWNQPRTFNAVAVHTAINGPQKALSCHEPSTNRTYQPNEIIPKDDPCKTCTCVLGEELCQTLVCPEKPDENCSEERRAGECCANYLCGSTVSQYANLSQRQPTPMQPISVMFNPMKASVNPSDSLMPSARLLANNNNNNGNRSPMRAMNVDSAFGNLANGLDQRQQPQQPPRPNTTPQQNGASQLGPQQPGLPILQTIQSIVGSNRARIPIDSFTNRHQHHQQLPQNPIRTSDLANLLPPHLRFRPNLLQNGPATNLLADLMHMDGNKVQFTGQQQRPEINNQAIRRNDMSNSNMAQTTNLGSQSLPNGVVWSQFNSQRVGGSAVRPQILLPPQRAGQMVSNLSHQTIRANNDEPGNFRRLPQQQAASPTMQAPHNLARNQRPPTSNFTPLANSILPQNILMSRMSGHQQIPVSQPVANNMDQQGSSDEGTSANSWKKNNGPVQLLQTTPTPQSTPLIFKSSVTSEPPAQKLDSIQQPAATIGANDNNRASGSSEQADIQRVMFQHQTQASSTEISKPTAVSSNTVDTSGFRPILSGSQRIDAGSTGVPPEVSSTQSKEELTSSTTASPLSTTSIELADTSSTTTARSSEPALSSTSRLESDPMTPAKLEPIALPEQNFLPTQKPSIAENYPKSDTVAQQNGETKQYLAAEKPAPIFSQTTTGVESTKPEMIPSSTSSSTEPSTTDVAVSTPTTDSPRPTVDNEFVSSEIGAGAGGESSDQSGSTTNFDPLAMFRVSECNIYGRIYKVGQGIEELSDVCKHCTCTQMGVDCQRTC